LLRILQVLGRALGGMKEAKEEPGPRHGDYTRGESNQEVGGGVVFSGVKHFGHTKGKNPRAKNQRLGEKGGEH